jgi:hypothetical protein
MEHTQGAPSWVWSPLAGARWTTVITWAALFAVVAWRSRNPLKGVVVAMCWLSGYEILYEATGSVLHGWSLTSLMFTTAGTAGWLVAAFLWQLWPDWRVLAVFAVMWAVWIVAGYNSNMPDRIIPGADVRWSWSDELLNVGTKTVMALAFIVATLRRPIGREVRAKGDLVHFRIPSAREQP